MGNLYPIQFEASNTMKDEFSNPPDALLHNREEHPAASFCLLADLSNQSLQSFLREVTEVQM